MRLIYGLDDAAAAWVASRIAHVANADELRPYVAVGMANDDGQPVGGIVWHGWRPGYRGIELTAAATDPRWLTRSIVREVFAYPFLTLDCVRVTTFTPASNRRALKLNAKLGFQHEGVVRLGYGDEDAVIMGLLCEEWLVGRWGPGPNALPRLYARAVPVSLELH